MQIKTHSFQKLASHRNTLDENIEFLLCPGTLLGININSYILTIIF